MLYIAIHNFNVQLPLFDLKSAYNAKQKFMAIQKYGKCYIQATASLKTPLPISGMVKVKPSRFVQEKYNLSNYKHL